MKLIRDNVIQFSNRDDLRTIELDYDYHIDSESQLASILLDLDYDYGDISTSEDIQVMYKGYKEKFYSNGFDMICAFKALNR